VSRACAKSHPAWKLHATRLVRSPTNPLHSRPKLDQLLPCVNRARIVRARDVPVPVAAAVDVRGATAPKAAPRAKIARVTTVRAKIDRAAKNLVTKRSVAMALAEIDRVVILPKTKNHVTKCAARNAPAMIRPKAPPVDANAVGVVAVAVAKERNPQHRRAIPPARTISTRDLTISGSTLRTIRDCQSIEIATSSTNSNS